MFFKNNKLGIIWSLTIIVICIVPGGNISGTSILDSLGIDKIIHGFVHLVLVVLVTKGLLKQTALSLTKRKALLFAFSYSFLLGIFIEIIQSEFIQGRSGDILDVVANAIGAILGVLLYGKLQHFIDLKQDEIKNTGKD